MGFTITSVSPDTVFSDGGREIVVTGVFEKGHRYRVHLGDLGTIGDPPCYSGVTGQGYFAYPKASVAGGAFDTLTVYSPKVVPGLAAYNITVQDYDTLEAHMLSGVVSAVKNQFYTTVYSERKVQPPRYATGPRGIERERPT